MSRRTERVGNLIRNTLGQMLLAKLSDPRIDPAATSITRVEMPEDLLTARVYISVAGDEKKQKRTLIALQHAAGFLQDRLKGEGVRLRHTPQLQFLIDTQFKKTIETLNILAEVSQELEEADRRRADDRATDPPTEAEDDQAPPAPDDA